MRVITTRTILVLIVVLVVLVAVPNAMVLSDGGTLTRFFLLRHPSSRRSTASATLPTPHSPVLGAWLPGSASSPALRLIITRNPGWCFIKHNSGTATHPSASGPNKQQTQHRASPQPRRGQRRTILLSCRTTAVYYCRIFFFFFSMMTPRAAPDQGMGPRQL